jgi:dihydroxy-acid dehydratase
VGLEDFDKASRIVPVIANIRPSGDTYLMEDFYYAGGLAGMMTRLTSLLHLDAKTVSGVSLGETLKTAMVHNDDVIRTLENPIYAQGALAVLKGNLAPNGCVIKPSACAQQFLQHTGRALVYDDYPSLKKASEDLDLDVTENDILVLRNSGPQGAGMPESGMLPIPTKLVKQGVKDMIRISDARMSGTSYGACILHVSPEAHIGGTLALVKTGDTITVDVPAGTIHLNVSDQELALRRAAWIQPKQKYERGYGYIFAKHVMQAELGCDFDFLETSFGAPVQMKTINQLEFEIWSSLGCSNSDYRLVETTCCRTLMFEDIELNDLFFNPRNSKDVLHVYDDFSICPICKSEHWDFIDYEGNSQLPNNYQWHLTQTAI